MKVLIANRAEVAIRIARSAAALGLETCAVYSRDDAKSLHVGRASEARALRGSGPGAYLDIPAVVDAAHASGATVVHPGWGFLAEEPAFARRCADAGLTFAGPSPDVLETFGDKSAALALAEACDVPVLASARSLDAARALMDHGPVVVKAVAGGGGRGMRAVRDARELDAAWERCQAEALHATGVEDVYAERLLERARHVEVQVAGDAAGRVVALGDRDCSVQRRFQKLIEVAPAPGLDPGLRGALHEAAVRMAREAGLTSLATFEFLVGTGRGEGWVFIEANPRLQVEHTVTEEVTGLDLVALQLRIARGEPLDLDGWSPEPDGAAVQVRLNAETLRPDGAVVPSAGTLTRWSAPAGDGVRVDTHAYEGYELPAAFDSLLAKVIVRAGDLPAALAGAGRALQALEVEGVETNREFLLNVLHHPAFGDPGAVTTSFVAEHLTELVPAVAAGAEGTSPLAGVVVEVVVPEGGTVRAGGPVLVVEAMKMHHEVVAPAGGVVRGLAVGVGDRIAVGDRLFRLDAAGADAVDEGAADDPADAADPDRIRPDLEAVLARRAMTLDAARPAAVDKRRRLGRRTTRENLDQLLDAGTFSEYGALTIAAQRARRDEDDLIRNTPGDGIVTGIGAIGGVRAAVLAYDYTVLAGTQGVRNHRKTDRLIDLAERGRLPVVLFAEGGGGRPGDTDQSELFHLVVPTFRNFARLSGLVPRIGIVSGRCFAGNAALLGCCDVVIATPDATVGMGGPAMIEGGGLGRFAPEEVGPVDMQRANGVIDVVAADEAEAVDVARALIGLLGAPAGGEDVAFADQRLLRDVIPEDPKRIHDVRRLVELLFDTGSAVELRPDWGRTMYTGLARIEGRAVGVIANDPRHLSGALDADGSEKAARHIQLCDAFGLPVISLVDTPGFMVGPDSEATGMVRRSSRLFTAAATASVPVVSVVVRRAFGLGAQAMTAGAFHAPVLNVAWPTGEFGAMGVEGAVRLALSKELAAIEDPEEREQRVRDLVASVRAQSGALNMATFFEIDDVIDPADTRERIAQALAASPATDWRAGRRRTMVDTW